MVVGWMNRKWDLTGWAEGGGEGVEVEGDGMGQAMPNVGCFRRAPEDVYGLYGPNP